MNQKQIILLASLLLALILSGCGSEGMYQITVVTEGEHRINSTTAGELIVMGGDVTIEKFSVLDGSAHLVSGRLTLEGQIHGDVSILGGTLVLGEDAEIEGMLNHGGGDVEGTPSENVVGKINTGTGIQIPELGSPQEISVSGQIARFVSSAALAGLIALGLNRYLPKHLNLVGETIVQHVWVATAIGILTGIVGLTLVVLMAYTILLIPVALLGFFVLCIAILFGWISLAIYIGQKTAPNLASSKPKLLVFSSVFLVLLGMNFISLIPMIGGITNIFFAVIGLGAVFLTRFGMRRFIPETVLNQN